MKIRLMMIVCLYIEPSCMSEDQPATDEGKLTTYCIYLLYILTVYRCYICRMHTEF